MYDKWALIFADELVSCSPQFRPTKLNRQPGYNICRLTAVAERMVREESGGWMKQVEEYMRTVGVSHEELTKMKTEKNNLKVNEWEETRWRTEVEERNPGDIAYRAKNKIGEGLYSNDSGSMTLFRRRTNTIKLNWRQRFQGRVVDCPVCDCESGAEETQNTEAFSEGLSLAWRHQGDPRDKRSRQS